MLKSRSAELASAMNLTDGHRPTMGYTPSNCVIVLGMTAAEDVAHQLTTFAKNELGYGYLIKKPNRCQ